MTRFSYCMVCGIPSHYGCAHQPLDFELDITVDLSKLGLAFCISCGNDHNCPCCLDGSPITEEEFVKAYFLVSIPEQEHEPEDEEVIHDYCACGSARGHEWECGW